MLYKLEDRILLSQRESQNILEYSRLEYVIVTQKNPKIFKAHTILSPHLECSYRIVEQYTTSFYGL